MERFTRHSGKDLPLPGRWAKSWLRPVHLSVHPSVYSLTVRHHYIIKIIWYDACCLKQLSRIWLQALVNCSDLRPPMSLKSNGWTNRPNTSFPLSVTLSHHGTQLLNYPRVGQRPCPPSLSPSLPLNVKHRHLCKTRSAKPKVTVAVSFSRSALTGLAHKPRGLLTFSL